MAGKHVARQDKAGPFTPISDEDKQRFLELVAAGKSRPEAAALVGSTGSRFRAICNPKSPRYDAEFAAAYEEARDSQHAVIADDLRREYVRVALDPDNPQQGRALHNNLVFYDPEWRAAHQQRMAVGAKASQDGEIQILLAFTGSDSDADAA